MQQGHELLQAGALEKALAEFTRAEELYSAAGDGQREARACTNKALVLVQMKRFEDALDGFRWSLKLFEKGDEFIRVAEQYGNIGSVHRDLEQPDEALENYAEALAIYEELGLRERAADQSTNIAYARFMKKELTKAEIRTLAREMGLPNWDKPAAACLSSRVPYGTTITLETLSRIEQAERVLINCGFPEVRVRSLESTARIEVPPQDFSRLSEQREDILQKLRELGYVYITLDLQGFRSGSMNEALTRYGRR